MKRIFLGLFLVAGAVSLGHSASLIERSGYVLGTFQQPIKFVAGKSAAIGYARTFQKSSTDNRLIGLLPIAEWGVLNVNLVGATPDFNDLKGQQGLLGVGGGVQANRVLSVAFPETASIFVGDIPGTNGKFTYEMQFGALAGYDFTRSEAVTGIYVTPAIKF